MYLYFGRKVPVEHLEQVIKVQRQFGITRDIRPVGVILFGWLFIGFFWCPKRKK
jgi:hypothetical protein